MLLALAPERAAAQTRFQETIINVARATGLDADGRLLEDTGRAEIDVERVAHVGLSAGRAQSARPGTWVEFPHTVTNLGDYAETFAIGAGSSTGWGVELAGPGGVASGDTVYLGPLAPGDSAGVLLRVNVPAAAPPGLLETATVSARAGRLPQEARSATDRIQVEALGLDPLRLDVVPTGVVPPRAVLTYRLAFGNSDPQASLPGLVFEDGLDAALAEVLELTSGAVPDVGRAGSAVAVTGAFDPVARRVTWQLDPLPPGFQGELVLVVRTAGDVAAGTRIANRVLARAPSFGVATSNEVTTTVVPPVLELQLAAATPQIDPGDAVLWSLTASNRSPLHALDSVRVDVRLPPGFRFQDGGGRDLRLAAGSLEPGASRTWTLAGAASERLEKGSHAAVATAHALVLGDLPLASQTAAPVTIPRRLGFEATLLGRVYVDDDSSLAPGEFEGLPGVRLVLEDGTQCITDARGRFHLEGMRPGVHVLRLDRAGLPEALRFDAELSRFVEVGPEAVAKVNFRARYAPGTKRVRHEIAVRGETWRFDDCVLFEPDSAALWPAAARVLADLLRHDAPADSMAGAVAADAGRQRSAGAPAPATLRSLDAEEPAALTGARRQALEVALGIARPAEDAAPAAPEPPLAVRIRSMTPDPAILAPADGAVSRDERATILVKLPSDALARLFVNDQEASPALVGSRVESPANEVACLSWVGVPLRAGENRLRFEAWGDTLRGAATARVFLAGPPAGIELAAEEVPADGIATARVAVRVLDAAGLPVAHALFATVDSEGGLDAEDADPRRDGFQVRLRDGAAMLVLAPARTTDARRVVVRCGDAVAAAYLRPLPAQRAWLVSGLAQASLAARPSRQPLDADQPAPGAALQAGLFAEGRVGRAGQLTLGIDTRRDRDALFGTPDTERLLPAVGDAAATAAGAPSAWPIFARYASASGHAQVGDFRTGWTDLELGRFDRALTGFDTGWRSARDRVALEGFAAAAPRSTLREDLPGRGVSGPFVLRQRPLVVHGERVSIETRDRFHSERVLAQRTLARDADYTIDYANGLLHLREPLAGADPAWNPNYLVVVYGAERDAPSQPAWGVRGRTAAVRGLAAGFLAVREEAGAIGRGLLGGDATWSMRPDLVASGEFARSTGDARDDAFRFALQHQAGPGRSVRLELRDVGTRFENPSGPAPGEVGTRKVRLESRWQLDATSRVQVDASLARDRRRGDERRTAGADWLRDGRRWSTAVGGRTTSAADAAGARVAHLLAGRVRRQIGARAGIEAGYQQAFGRALAMHPTRLAVGADVGVTERIALRLRQEWDGSDTGRSATLLGLESRLDERTVLASRYELQSVSGSARGSAHVGLRTAVPLGRGWSATAAAERGRVTTEADRGSGSLSLGAAWSVPHRLLSLQYELLASGDLRQHGLRAGLSTRLGRDWTLVGRERWFGGRNGTGSRSGHDLVLGWAYRPLDRDAFVWLASVRFRANVAPTESPEIAASRLVLALQGNLEFAPRWSLASGLGVRRATASDARARATSTALLAHARLVREIAPRLDAALGLRARTRNGGGSEWSGGLESGVRILKDVWVVAGYNLVGFADPDFAATEHTAHAGYISLRVKLDL